MMKNTENNLEHAIKDFVAYLDKFDYESGDTPCLHLSWYRSGNSRREKMQANGSLLLEMDCHVAIKRPDVEQAYKDGYLFEYFKASGENLLACVAECRRKTAEYIERVYG